MPRLDLPMSMPNAADPVSAAKDLVYSIQDPMNLSEEDQTRLNAAMADPNLKPHVQAEIDRLKTYNRPGAEFTPDQPSGLSTGEGYAKALLGPAFYGVPKGEVAGKMGIPAHAQKDYSLTPAEKEQLKRFVGEHPGAELASEVAGPLINLPSNLVALLGGRGPVKAGLKAALARMGMTAATGPAISAAQTYGETGSGEQAMEAGMETAKSPANLAITALALPDVAQSAARTMRTGIRNRPELARTAQRADTINEARQMQKQAPAPVKEFLGESLPQGEAAIQAERAKTLGPIQKELSQEQDLLSNIERQAAEVGDEAANAYTAKATAAKAQAQKQLEQVKRAGESYVEQGKVKAAGEAFPKIREGVQKRIEGLRARAGQAYGDSANQLISDNPNVPVNTTRLVQFIDEVKKRFVGIKDPAVLAQLDDMKDQLQGLPPGAAKQAEEMRAAGAKYGIKPEEFKMPAQFEPKPEIPLKDYVKISREFKYPGDDSASSAFRRKFYRMMSDNLRDNPSPVTKDLSGLMRSYHEAITPLDDVQYRLSTPGGRGSTELSALEVTKTPEGKAKYQELTGETAKGLGTLEQKTGAKGLTKSFGRATKTLEETGKEYEGAIAAKSGIAAKAEEQAKLRSVQEAEQISGEAQAAKKGLKLKTETAIGAQKAKIGALEGKLKAAEGEFGGLPKDRAEIAKTILNGDLDTLNDEKLVALSKKNPAVKEMVDRGKDWATAKKLGRGLWEDVIHSVVHPMFAKYRAVREAANPVFRQKIILKSKAVQDWIKAADEQKIYKSATFRRATRGIWPLGLSAREALPKILADEDKTKKLEEALSEENFREIGNEYLQEGQ